MEGTSFDEPSGAFDESFVPRENAMSLVSHWEVLLRRTTIYLCTWAEGIVSPRVLRKYIEKDNRSWIKLYRYIWLKSQSNHLTVFPSPKTFALATCVECAADEKIRRRVIDETNLPAAANKDAFQFTELRFNDFSMVVKFGKSSNGGEVGLQKRLKIHQN